MRAAGRRQGFWFKARIIGIRKYAASRPAAAVSPESLWLAVSESVRQHRSVVMVKAVYCRWGLAMLACFLLVKKPGNRFCVCVCERDVVKPTGRSWSVSHSSSSAVVMHGADIVVRFSDL